MLVAETAAAGSDTDAQERALDAVRAAFAGRGARRRPGARQIELRMSGPGVFSVAARASIQHAVVRLSIARSALIVVVLLDGVSIAVALLLGLLPVATGALVGVAAVALGFGAVHGITLGFGVTLIGESVDYSIYFFIQSAPRRRPRAAAWQTLWPTMVLGMLASVCGFASLLPSGFPGLAQLGVYSICGLIAASASRDSSCLNCCLRRFQIRDLTPLGAAHAAWIAALRAGRQRRVRWDCALALGATALLVLYCARGRLWNRELSSLSPIPRARRSYDAQLRADLGAPNALDLVVVPAQASNRCCAARSARRKCSRLWSDAEGHRRLRQSRELSAEPGDSGRAAREPAGPPRMRENLDRAAARPRVRYRG